MHADMKKYKRKNKQENWMLFWLFIVGIVVVGGLLKYFSAERVKAYDFDDCECEDCCERPTSTLTPTLTLTPTPTPTPTVMPTMTVTPTPTVAPTEIPRQENKSEPGSPGAPQCTDLASIKTGANFHVYRKGSEAIAKWWPTEGDRAHIYFKQVDSSEWQYALRDIKNNGYAEIHDLGNLDITFALQQANGCAGGALTDAVVDGASREWVLFR